MPTEAKQRHLFDQISSQTEAGKLTWSETAEEDEFITLFGEGKFVLKALRYTEVDFEGDKVGPPSFQLIRNEDDTVLLTLTAVSSGKARYEFENTFQMIHDQALGINSAVDEVLAELGFKDDDIPF